MKIAHISDTHLGYTQYRLSERKKDFFLAFEKAVDRIIEERIDIVIHTGDLFETHQPDMVTLSQCIGILQKLKNAGIEFITITGNHDRVLRKGTIPPHKILEELGLLKLVDPYGVLKMGDLFIAGFRYLPKRMIQQLKASFFEKLQEEVDKSKYSILMFHQGIGQYLPHEESFEMEIFDLPQGFKYYAGGHIHVFVKEKLYNGIFSYAGSTEFRSKKEVLSGRRGFNIFDFKTNELKRIEIEGLRSFELLKVSEDKDDIKEKLKELSQRIECYEIPPVVLIDYVYKTTEPEVFKVIFQEIERRALYLKINKKRVTEETIEIESEKGKSFSEFLTDFLKEKNYGETVIKLAEEVIESQTEHVEDILKDYVKKEVGKDWEEIEKYLQESF
ncbi:metallophosphoesterase [Desulfurobacterium thermolithotrophum DSM 11699]|uniref:Metallophosphoesterase n=1 Tax=Desulfurobacterium thermolithotrophum (strain DSM 11699 / BSA) TaxID=868864 RepID=F0S247_DESTD|nr:DNA repair exonuclease [Desulfurobacterium thermolithotrophum]ADY72990.1 metallophosphoesterase [Desulfurobacterium thermolithotrophum DSM 11699]